MHNIYVPETVEAYQTDLHAHALPDTNLATHDFYKRLIGWVVDKRTPLLYEQDHDDEYTNFSINFNWLLLRDYRQTALGSAATIATMYGLHEFTHMTHQLHTRLDEISAAEYAEAFTRSEYRASNETEVLIHYRVPNLREVVFPGMKIAYDILRERRIAQPSMALLCAIRPLIIEHDVLDGWFEDSAKNKAVGQRFKSYQGNRPWALKRFDAIKPYFSGQNFPESSGLTDNEYESVIATYRPSLSQQTYEANIVRNVRFGYAMCGLAVPAINTFAQAQEAATQLEGQHAIVQS